jgi:hypothetical protein
VKRNLGRNFMLKQLKLTSFQSQRESDSSVEYVKHKTAIAPEREERTESVTEEGGITSQESRTKKINENWNGINSFESELQQQEESRTEIEGIRERIKGRRHV